MKTRIIHTKIWEDDWFYLISNPARLLFLYLLTNVRINLIGCYEIPDRIILSDTKFSHEELEMAKKELKPKAVFANGWVYIPKSRLYGGYKGEKNDNACIKEYNAIPKPIRDTLSIPYPYPSDTTINHKSEIINQKPEIRKENYSVNSKTVEDPEERVRSYLEGKGIVMEVGK